MFVDCTLTKITCNYTLFARVKKCCIKIFLIYYSSRDEGLLKKPRQDDANIFISRLGNKYINTSYLYVNVTQLQIICKQIPYKYYIFSMLKIK